MRYMFFGAEAFNQDLSQWNVSNVTDMTNIFSSAELSVNNYDALIISWKTQLGESASLSSVNFNGGTSKFCEAANPGVPGEGQDCYPRIIRVTLDAPASGNSTLTLRVTFSEPVFADGTVTGALEADDFNVKISGTGATLTDASGTPTSISQQGNSYTLDVTITNPLQEDHVIEVLPLADSIYDANGNAASGS
jgi:surface protein